MTRPRRLIPLAVLILGLVAVTPWLRDVRASGGQVSAVYTLPDLPLMRISNEAIPGSVKNDRLFLLGGIGSDLWHGPTDAGGEFWMITDRGPNGQIRVEGANRRTFPVPGYTPLILRVKTGGSAIMVQEIIPIRGRSGAGVTGLSNIRGVDETPYDFAAMELLEFNPNGLDTEGIVQTRVGEFWLVDEYSPSILRVGRNGVVAVRYIPGGVALAGTDYPVEATLPAIFGKRKINRGFEGVAISPDEATLYAALQSPLVNPDTATGNASRVTHILALDTATGQPTADYAYVFDEAAQFERNAKPEDMKLSGLVIVNPTTMLVLERTDDTAKVYSVDLTAADNLLGTKWLDPATRPTLGSLDDPSTQGLKALPKTLVIDLSTLPGMPKKIEGLALLDARTLVVANDDDYDIGDMDDAGNNIASGAKSQILYITLDMPLPLMR